MSIKFGPAGNDKSFYGEGHTSSLEMPEWLNKIGLNAYEYQCGRGVNISENTAKEFGAKAREFGITLSLHAPYYISLSSVDEEKRDNSIKYIHQSAKAAKAMGADRITIHSGSCAKMERETALELAKQTLKRAIDFLDAEGFEDLHLCPETMGKINQLGTLEEVLELCKLDERLIPTIDFGHINARTQGGLKTYSDFEDILNTIENALGFERLKHFHSHFSKIEYSAGGEKKHLTFEDTVYGPEFEPIAELVYKKALSPTFICESEDCMALDALKMKNIYNTLSKGG